LNQALNNINNFYENLVPSKYDGLLIYLLVKKFKHKEIPKYFSYSDIQNAIRDVATIYPGSSLPHTEGLLKRLLHFFEKSSKSTYQVYANGLRKQVYQP